MDDDTVRPDADAKPADSTGHHRSGEPSAEAPTVIRTRTPGFSSPKSPVEGAKRLPGIELVGVELDHYRLEQLIGGGGMGSVYRGIDLDLGRTVAVKVISAVANSSDALRRFKTEAQNAARLDHDNIARVYYVGETEDWNYIVFEYIEGENLRERVIRSGPLSIEDVLLYAAQVSEALDHAWERNVVHRDIKPSNIVVQPNGTVKLVDMGLARLQRADATADEITASEVILGTFDYISPEQAKNPRSADVRSDLYSLGCTMYFLLTGSPPFPRDSALQKLLSHTGEAPPDPCDLRPDLDPAVTVLVHRLMAKDPDRRFQTPREFTAQLILLSTELSIPLGGRKTRLWVERPTADRMLWHAHVAWVVPLTILFCVVGGLYLTRSAESVSWQLPVYRPALPSLDDSDVDGDVSDVDRPDAAAADPLDTDPETAPENEDGEAVHARDEPMPRDGGDSSTGGTAAPSRGEASTADDTDSENSSQPTDPTEDPTDSSDRPELPAGVDSTSSGRGTEESDPDVALDVDRVIVVSDEPPLDEELDLWRTDLATAIRLANENPTVSRIELRYDGPRIQQPSRVANKRDLTIAAADGYAPSVLFSPELDNALGTKHMLEISGAHVSWEDIPVRMTLPELEPANGWAIFALREGKSLDVARSTLTIENRDANGIVWHYNVSAFLLANADMQPVRVPGEDDPMAQSRSAIRISACIIRGQATLLRLEKAAAFKLTWTDGLFASDQLMFDLKGAVEDQQVDGTMEIDLTRVTARVPGGLARVNLDGRMFPVPMHLAMNFCIVLAEPSIPLVEHSGLRDSDEVDKLLRMTGQRNAYPSLWPEANNPPLRERVAWSAISIDADEISLSFSEENPTWKDFGPGTMVAWVNKLPDTLPVHEHRPDHYRVERTGTNPAEQAGFADGVLPSNP
jgi:predicted Ser/Thr protein kinase